MKQLISYNNVAIVSNIDNKIRKQTNGRTSKENKPEYSELISTSPKKGRGYNGNPSLFSSYDESCLISHRLLSSLYGVKTPINKNTLIIKLDWFWFWLLFDMVSELVWEIDLSLASILLSISIIHSTLIVCCLDLKHLCPNRLPSNYCKTSQMREPLNTPGVLWQRPTDRAPQGSNNRNPTLPMIELMES